MVVLSYDFWTRRFARDPEVLGQTLYVKGVPLTIIGVSAAGFTGLQRGTGDTDFWVPLQNRRGPQRVGRLRQWRQDVLRPARPWWCLLLTGRLAPGVTPQQAVSRLRPQFQNARLHRGSRSTEAGRGEAAAFADSGQRARRARRRLSNGHSTR